MKISWIAKMLKNNYSQNFLMLIILVKFIFFISCIISETTDKIEPIIEIIFNQEDDNEGKVESINSKVSINNNDL